MGIEELIIEPTDSPVGPLKYNGRAWKYLVQKYGDVVSAENALDKIRVMKAPVEIGDDGKTKPDQWIPPTQDQSYFDALENWLTAGRIGAEKDTNCAEVGSWMGEASLSDMIKIFVPIFTAFMAALPKARGDADPQKA